MPDLTTNCAGIRSVNPFWLASAPPANSGEQVKKAFDMGWGGAVWKTLGTPIQNTSSRFGSIDHRNSRAVGFNNIELITDRPLERNFREIYELKKAYPDHAIVASLMVETKAEWQEMVKRAIDAGADGLELNFGCPHGMCERGMGSAVGQEPRVNEEITSWAVDASTIPVLVKLTPNVTNILDHGRAAQRGGAQGVSLINTIKSVVGVDIDNFVPLPSVGRRATSGGFCGAAVKPIALHMISQLSTDDQFNLPISGIGGITNWRDAVEFILLGSSSVQVCTEVMLRGYLIIEDMVEGLEDYMSSHGFEKLDDFIGKAVPAYGDWGELDMNYESVAKIDADSCIGCHVCVVACEDGAHQCIHPDPTSETRVPTVDEDECVGCNLCQIVCPVPDCISMVEVDNSYAPVTWNEHVQDGKPIRPKKGVHP